LATARRRNKWICALKEALVEIGIYGPKGDPDKPETPVKYTKIPWEEVKAGEQRAAKRVSMPAPPGGWHLSDQNAGMRMYLFLNFSQSNVLTCL